MPFDGVFLYNVRKELLPLIGARVEKIYEPSREKIVIALRSKEGAKRLLLSASGSDARVQLTDNRPENPKIPPMFCSLLRKHLNCAKLTDIRQDKLERILFLDFEAVDELGDLNIVTVAAEIMGKYSNVILINHNGKIIDSLKRVTSEMSRERIILPGSMYSLPPREERLDFLTASSEEILYAMKNTENKDSLLSKATIKIFEGISPLVAREWVYRTYKNTNITVNECLEKAPENFICEIFKTRDDIISGNLSYVIIRDNENNAKDFSFTHITQYEDSMKIKECENAFRTLDEFYLEKDVNSGVKQRSNDLYKLLKSTDERIEKRLCVQKNELLVAEDRDEYKLKGDLIAANLYNIEKGTGIFEVENFYDENKIIKIELDKRLTPTQNMQKYYNEYRKADNAEKILTSQIQKGEEEKRYIESVIDILSRSQTEEEISSLREELYEQGYLKKRGKKEKSNKPLPPKMYKSPDGFDIAVGRNNIQNDKLTLKTAEKTDIWLHTKDIPGSHVIIFAHGKQVPETTIIYAARIAAANSKARNSSRVPVDYVPVKLVKKPAGAKPGKVIFTGNKTLYVIPLEASN